MNEEQKKFMESKFNDIDLSLPSSKLENAFKGDVILFDLQARDFDLEDYKFNNKNFLIYDICHFYKNTFEQTNLSTMFYNKTTKTNFIDEALKKLDKLNMSKIIAKKKKQPAYVSVAGHYKHK